MKNIFYSIFVLFILNSCNENNSTNYSWEPISTTIVGNINNAPYPNIIFTDDNQRFEAQVVNGKFMVNADLTQAALYIVAYGRDKSTVFVNPGDTLFLNAEGQQFSRTLSFKGMLADENAYLSEKALLDRQRYSVKVKDYKLGESEFIAAMDYTRKQNQSEFDKSAKEKNFNSAFIKLMNDEITYEWATDRVNYKLYYEFYNKVENLELNDTYYDFLNDLNYDDASILGSVNYKNFISNYTTMSVQKELASDESSALKDNGEALAKFNFINATFKDSDVVDFLLYTTLKQHIRYEGANGTKELLDIFNSSSNNENHKADILKDYAHWENLAEGDIAPTFNYADMNGTLHGLENFKGKYVYIDVWATWCGPCRKELPHLEELQEKYKNSDKIVFTSVSIDQDSNSWRKMVAEQEMQGVQLLADAAWQSSIVRDYKISGIPRFLLIDPQGDIISVNAPRPSSERIKAKLAHLIEM
jgi:thiol-disulfide isomerase/thioredoxin